MRPEEFAKLKAGDRVTWAGHTRAQGTVVEMVPHSGMASGYVAMVQWDNPRANPNSKVKERPTPHGPAFLEYA